MATVLQEKEDQEQQSSQNQPIQLQNAAPSSNGQTVGQVPNQQQAPRQQGSGSGLVTNVSKYLQANKQAPGQSLGEKISQRIGSQADKIRSGIESSRQQFQEQVQPEQQRLQSAPDRINALISQAKTTPSGLTQDQINEYAKLRQGQSFAPTGLNNANELQSGVQNVNQLAGATQNEADRFGLLRQFFGTPTYSKGQRSLDQMLLQSTPGQLGTLQRNANQAATQTQQALQQAQGMSGDILSQLAQQRGAAQQQANTGVTTEQQAINKAVADSATQQTQQRQSLYDNLYNTLNGKPHDLITNEQIQSLGLDPNMQVAGLKLKDYMKNANELPLAVSQQQALTPEQQASLQGLAQLAGQDPAGVMQRQELKNFNPFDPEAINAAASSARDFALHNRNINISGLPSILTMNSDTGKTSAADLPALIAQMNAASADQARGHTGMRVRDQPYAQARDIMKRLLQQFNAEQQSSTLARAFGIPGQKGYLGGTTNEAPIIKNSPQNVVGDLLDKRILPPGVKA